MRLGLLLLYVEDFPAMFAFYRDVLRLEVTEVDPGPGHRPGVDWVQLAGEGGTIELFDHATFGRSRSFPYPRSNGVVITFKAESVEVEVERLRAAGVDVPRIHRAEWGAAAHFFDPEGNELQVFESASDPGKRGTLPLTRRMYPGSGSVGQVERGHHDRAVAARRVQALGRAAVDEVRQDRVDAAADAELVPDVREDHGAAVGEVLLQVGEVREGSCGSAPPTRASTGTGLDVGSVQSERGSARFGTEEHSCRNAAIRAVV